MFYCYTRITVTCLQQVRSVGEVNETIVTVTVTGWRWEEVQHKCSEARVPLMVDLMMRIVVGWRMVS